MTTVMNRNDPEGRGNATLLYSCREWSPRFPYVKPSSPGGDSRYCGSLGGGASKGGSYRGEQNHGLKGDHGMWVEFLCSLGRRPLALDPGSDPDVAASSKAQSNMAADLGLVPSERRA